jgi:hypothetical protein
MRSQHALDVLLRQGNKVADGHSQGGNDRQDPAPFQGDLREDDDEHTDEDCKSRRLGCSGEKTSDWGRRTLINVRRPEVEGHGSNLEGETDQEKEDHADGQRIEGFEDSRHLLEAGGAGETVEQAQTIEQDCGCHGAEKQVLEARFDRKLVVEHEAREHVEGDGGGLHRQE